MSNDKELFNKMSQRINAQEKEHSYQLEAVVAKFMVKLSEKEKEHSYQLEAVVAKFMVKLSEKDIIIENANKTIVNLSHKFMFKLAEKDKDIAILKEEKAEMVKKHDSEVFFLQENFKKELETFSSKRNSEYAKLAKQKDKNYKELADRKDKNYRELVGDLALDLKYKEKQLDQKESELKKMTYNRDEEGRKYLNAQRLLDEEFKNKVLPGEVHMKLTLAFDKFKELENDVTTLVKEIRDEFAEVVRAVGVTEIIPAVFIVKNHSSVPQTKCVGKSSSGIIEETEEDTDTKFTCNLELTINNQDIRKDLVMEGFENEFKMRNLIIYVDNIPVNRWEMTSIRGFTWTLPDQFQKVGKYTVRYDMHAYVKNNEPRKVNWRYQFVLNVVPCRPFAEYCTIEVIREVNFKMNGSVGSAEGSLEIVEKKAFCGEGLFVHVQLRNEKNEIIKKRNTTVLFSSTNGSIEDFKFTFAEEDYDEEEQKYKTSNPINIPIAGTFRISLVDIGTVFEFKMESSKEERNPLRNKKKF